MEKLGNVKTGGLTTLSRDTYPGLGKWWVQLWVIQSGESTVLARVYGDTPEEARKRAETIAEALNINRILVATIESGYSGDPDTIHEKCIKPVDKDVIKNLPLGTKLYKEE